MNTKQALEAIHKLIADFSPAERIDIGHNILLNADAFGVSFSDRSDIDLCFEALQFDDDRNDYPLTEQEYAQIVVNCREKFRKTNDCDMETEIYSVLNARK